MRWHVEVKLSNGTWRAVRPSGALQPYELPSLFEAREFARRYYPDHTLGSPRVWVGVRVVGVDDTGKRDACDHCTQWIATERVRDRQMGFWYYADRNMVFRRGGEAK